MLANRRSLCVVGAALLTGCTAKTPVSSKYVVSQAVSASAGATPTITSADCNGQASCLALVGTSLAIPAGALAEDTTITMTVSQQAVASGNQTALGPVVEFGPDGLQFLHPATLTLPATIPAGVPSFRLAIAGLESSGQAVLITSGVSVSSSANTVTGPISGFTAFGAVEVPATAMDGGKPSPEVMLVIDRSGSMTDPGDASGASCADQNGCYTGQSGGDCKWNELLDVMLGQGSTPGGFVDQLAATGVSLGMTYFSGDMAACTQATIADSCSTGVVAVPFGADGGAAIKQTLSGLTPGGGTPTTATMAMVGSAFPAFQAGAPPRFALLLTDGAPNCDAQFSPTAANCSADRCTEDTSINQCPTWDNSCPCWFSGAPVPQTCLDETALIDEVQALYQQGIVTVVIGFGVENNGGSVGATIETLNQAAIAGGAAQDGGPTPPAGFTNFYSAASEGQLNAALQQIAALIASP